MLIRIGRSLLVLLLRRWQWWNHVCRGTNILDAHHATRQTLNIERIGGGLFWEQEARAPGCTFWFPLFFLGGACHFHLFWKTHPVANAPLATQNLCCACPAMRRPPSLVVAALPPPTVVFRTAAGVAAAPWKRSHRDSKGILHNSHA